jgi:hypothetical protein
MAMSVTFFIRRVWRYKCTKGIIRICKSKDRQRNVQKKLRCSGRVSSSCSTHANCRVNLVTSPVISYEWGKDREVFTTNGTYPPFRNTWVSFEHCVVGLSIYRFWLFLWYICIFKLFLWRKSRSLPSIYMPYCWHFNVFIIKKNKA